MSDPAAAVYGHRGDQHRWHSAVLHPGGHVLQHLHGLLRQHQLLRRQRASGL